MGYGLVNQGSLILTLTVILTLTRILALSLTLFRTLTLTLTLSCNLQRADAALGRGHEVGARREGDGLEAALRLVRVRIRGPMG